MLLEAYKESLGSQKYLHEFLIRIFIKFFSYNYLDYSNIRSNR
jgi:hypothetical protein